MGIPVRRLNGLVWALAAAVAAVAGLLLAPITFVHVNLGFIGLKAFPAAVIGGFGSLPGAIVGGLIIGVGEKVGEFYWGPLVGSGIESWLAYLIALAFLLFRPQGLFGDKIIERI
jgi:branched-chain amino acid transport system permease protein